MESYYEEFKGSEIGFSIFHNQIINMPRSSFSTAKYEHLQLLGRYIMHFKKNKEGDYFNYKEIYEFLLLQYSEGKLGFDSSFENRYFLPYVNNQRMAYDKIGRMFRHEMALANFFGLLKSESRNKKIIDEVVCEEVLQTPKELQLDLKRNMILSVDVKYNDFINNLKNIKEMNNIQTNRPAINILSYIQEMQRPVTEFELSIFFGKVDSNLSEENILERAKYLGKKFPIEQENQIKHFFNYMGWIDEYGNLYQYEKSQEPYFKFKVFLLLMVNFGLLNNQGEYFTLSTYGKQLLSGEQDVYLLDLESWISTIEKLDNSNLEKVSIESRIENLKHQYSNIEELIYNINRYSLQKTPSIVSKREKNNRSSIVMALAKYLNNYMCQVSMSFTSKGIKLSYNVPTFETNSGVNYTEGHHLLELGSEKGPDIIENLILIDSNTHAFLHYSDKASIQKFYREIRHSGLVEVERFHKMIDVYDCLKQDHIDALLEKNIINKNEYWELSAKIAKNS